MKQSKILKAQSLLCKNYIKHLDAEIRKNRMKRNSYLIKSTMEICPDSDECLYWHTEDGWVDKSSATSYCDKDLEWINLPSYSVMVNAATDEKIDL